MSSKKMVLIFVIAVVTFGLFMRYALKEIQTVDMTVTTTEQALDGAVLAGVIEALNVYKDAALTGGISIGEFSLLLIDHLNEEAALWHEGKTEVVEYPLLDTGITYSNHYMAYISNEPTLILNCDDLLGDAFERGVVLSYQYRLGSLSKLNPSNIQYFQSTEENMDARYQRYQMIGSLKKVYEEQTGLEAFGYHYQQWRDVMGEQYLQVTEYDYYDGLKGYLTCKVRQLREADYNIMSYMDEQKNAYGLYSKIKEYELMGMLWFLLAERHSIPLYEQDDVRSDRYKILLEGTPYGSVDDRDDYKAYEASYRQYANELTALVNEKSFEIEKDTPVTLNLLAETYEETIQIDESTYLYTGYKARQQDRSLIEQTYMIVEVSPYDIVYYVE